MKKQYINVTNKRVIIGALVELIVASLAIFLLATNTAPPFFSGQWILVIYWLIVLFLAMACGLFFIATVIALIVGMCINHSLNRRENQAENKVKSILSHEFMTVTLKDMAILQDILDMSTVSCKAKVDETGEIIFEININAEAKGHTDDYTYFLTKFDID